MHKILMNTENSKTNEQYKFFLNLLQKLDLKNLNKHIALFKMYLFITRGKITDNSKITVQKQ